MQTTAIRTVAKSLPQNKVILLTCLISNSYIPYTDLQKVVAKVIGIGVFYLVQVEILQELIPEEMDFYMIGSYLFHSCLHDV